jgi:hypothetical protein
LNIRRFGMTEVTRLKILAIMFNGMTSLLHLMKLYDFV